MGGVGPKDQKTKRPKEETRNRTEDNQDSGRGRNPNRTNHCRGRQGSTETGAALNRGPPGTEPRKAEVDRGPLRARRFGRSRQTSFVFPPLPPATLPLLPLLFHLPLPLTPSPPSNTTSLLSTLLFIQAWQNKPTTPCPVYGVDPEAVEKEVRNGTGGVGDPSGGRFSVWRGRSLF